MKAIKYALLGLAGVVGLVISAFGPVKIPFAEALAKSYYRYALGAVLLILLLISVAFGLFILTFDANNFKSEIVQFVKSRTQRDLLIEGNIKVTFLPKLGLDSGRVTLSQRNSAREFASISNARLYIAWWPLFKRRLVFDRVEINGIHANVTRLKDGSTNFDDLLIRDENLAPLTFDIDSVRITDSSINWQDEMESQQIALHNLKLETGRLADTLPSNLTASFRLNSERLRLNSNVNLKSRLFFDRKAGRYEFANIEGKLEGEAANISNLVLIFAGSLDSYPTQKSLSAENIKLTATGTYEQRLLDAKLDIPKLQIDKGKLIGNQFSFETTASYLDDTMTASLQAPIYEIVDKVFKAPEIIADFDFKINKRTLQGHITTPLDINFESIPKFQLDAISMHVSGNHPLLSGSQDANATGKLQADFSEQRAKLNFNAKFDDGQLTGNIAVKDFSHPAYTFDIHADHLDLDRHLAADWIKQFRQDATPLALTGLQDISMQGKLSAGDMMIAGVKASKLAAVIKIEKSTLTVAPLSAKLYGGSLAGSIKVDVQGIPQITVKQSLNDFQMSALLADTSGAGKLTGKGRLDLDFIATGNSIGELRKALNGQIALSVSRGAIAGINLQAALLKGKADLGTQASEQVYEYKFGDKTGFSDLKASFGFKDGVALDNRFEMKSPTIRTAGTGDMDYDSGNINYRLNATLAAALKPRSAGALAELKGVTVPMRVFGPNAAPSIAFDFASASGGKVTQIAAALAAKSAAAAAPPPPSKAKPKARISKQTKKQKH